MDIYQDVLGLAKGGLLTFQAGPAPAPTPGVAPPHRPEAMQKREEARQRTLARRKRAAAKKAAGKEPVVRSRRSEVAAVADLKTFTTCPVPIHAVINRETGSEGRADYWVLLDTAPVPYALRTRQEYVLRTSIEERHRQLKCFSDLEKFSSRAFSLVVHQVVFVLLVYRDLRTNSITLAPVGFLPKDCKPLCTPPPLAVAPVAAGLPSLSRGVGREHFHRIRCSIPK